MIILCPVVEADQLVPWPGHETVINEKQTAVKPTGSAGSAPSQCLWPVSRRAKRVRRRL